MIGRQAVRLKIGYDSASLVRISESRLSISRYAQDTQPTEYDRGACEQRSGRQPAVHPRTIRSARIVFISEIA